MYFATLSFLLTFACNNYYYRSLLRRLPRATHQILRKRSKCNPHSPAPLTYCRYLVPSDITVGKFVYEIRKHMKLSPEKAIFLFVNNTLPPTGMRVAFCLGWYLLVAGALVASIYERYKDEDGFLYFTYSGENTFGF